MSFIGGDLIYSYEIDHDENGNEILKHEIRAKVIGLDGKGKPLVNIISGEEYMGSSDRGRRFVRVGNTLMPARQNGIYYDAITEDNPRIVIYEGIDRFGKLFSHPTNPNKMFIDSNMIRAQVGNLGSIYDTSFGGWLTADQAETGQPLFGLYSDNVFLKGKIVIANPEDINSSQINNDAGFTKNKTYNQATAPVDAVEGDFWFDSENKILKRYNGSSWESVGIKGTYITGDGVYTGTVGAQQIVAGMLTGFTIQTSDSNPRVLIDGSENNMLVYDSVGIVRTQLGNLGTINDPEFGYLTDDGTQTGNPLYGLYSDSIYLNFSQQGRFLIKKDDNNYFSFDPANFIFKSENFSLTSENLGIYSGSEAKILLGHNSDYSLAKIGLLNDGSGKLADNNINWDMFGNVNFGSDISVTGDITMGDGKIWTDNAGEGASGFVIDKDGIRGYGSSPLGLVFNLPTNGNPPVFSSGIIRETVYEIYESSILRTSEFIGTAPYYDAGLLINDTGLYVCAQGQTLVDANVRILSDGTIYLKGEINILNQEDINTSNLTNGAGWTDDTTALQAIAEAQSAQTTADGKIVTYYQDTQPAEGSEGDIWFDTANGNKIYVYQGGQWVLSQDAEIGQAITDAAGAKATADGKVTTFYENTQPVAEGVGDLWIDTGNGNKLHRWDGTNWISVQDQDIADAITAAAAAQAAADGTIQTFYQPDEPTAGMNQGDIWFDTNDGNKIYVHDSVQWVLSQDEEIAIAIDKAQTAQTTADGKALVFYQFEPPIGVDESEGDLWVDTNDGNKLYRHNGTDWISIQDVGIIDNASKIKTDSTGKLTIAIPNPASAGLFMGSTQMGFHDGINWKTYMDNTGGFYLSGNQDHSLSWNGSTLSVSGSINIVNPDTAFNNNKLSTSNINNVAGWTDDSAAIAAQTTANSAQGTANAAQSTANSNSSKIMTDANGRLVTSFSNHPQTAGLHLYSDHLGFHNGNGFSSGWKTYMDDNGNFYLGGTNASLSWSSTNDTLDIQGGTFTGGTITGTTISGGIFKTNNATVSLEISNGSIKCIDQYDNTRTDTYFFYDHIGGNHRLFNHIYGSMVNEIESNMDINVGGNVDIDVGGNYNINTDSITKKNIILNDILFVYSWLQSIKVAGSLTVDNNLTLGGDLSVTGSYGLSASDIPTTLDYLELTSGTSWNDWALKISRTSYGHTILQHSTDGLLLRNYYASASSFFSVRNDTDIKYFNVGPSHSYIRGDFRPALSNTYDLGTTSYKWQDIYATNGVIQTSDIRDKTELNDSDLGLEFVNSLMPKRYKHTNGKRFHYGLLAQDIEDIIKNKLKKTDLDFAGFIYDEESDSYGLRYNEFIAPIIKAIQELSEEIQSVKEKSKIKN